MRSVEVGHKLVAFRNYCDENIGCLI